MADFVRRSELWIYDVFPKVIKAGKESTVHIRPFGGRNFFPAGSVREAVVTWLNGGDIEDAPASAFRKEIDVTANAENGLDIKMLTSSDKICHFIFSFAEKFYQLIIA